MQIVVDSTVPPPSVPRRITLIAAGFLVTVGIFMAVSGDFSRPSSSTSTTPTELAISSQTLGSNDGPLEDCANVKDWDFFNATVTQNNLAGAGPNTSDKQEIRYSNVSDMIDLVITHDWRSQTSHSMRTRHQCYGYQCHTERNYDGYYYPFKGSQNGFNPGGFGVLNLYVGTSLAVKFTLVEAGTDTPVQIAPDQTVFFTVFDIDSSSYANEIVQFITPVDSYKTTTSTTVQMSGDKNSLVAQSTRKGNGKDNPTDPLHMTQIQKDQTLYVSYKGRNTWTIDFSNNMNDMTRREGRNFLFAGRADGTCPPGPVKPPPGGCTAGIEGMFPGGGRVCCPDECGQQGINAKWAGAPNQCGGPGCEMGESGEPSRYRAMNCCPGRPISGGSTKGTITAPYGIASSGRFCTGLGSDGPPCINELQRADFVPMLL